MIACVQWVSPKVRKFFWSNTKTWKLEWPEASRKSVLRSLQGILVEVTRNARFNVLFSSENKSFKNRRVDTGCTAVEGGQHGPCAHAHLPLFGSGLYNDRCFRARAANLATKNHRHAESRIEKICVSASRGGGWHTHTHTTHSTSLWSNLMRVKFEQIGWTSNAEHFTLWWQLRTGDNCSHLTNALCEVTWAMSRAYLCGFYH